MRQTDQIVEHRIVQLWSLNKSEGDRGSIYIYILTKVGIVVGGVVGVVVGCCQATPTEAVLFSQRLQKRGS